MSEASNRVFLFLQGPHGPFFRRLADALSYQGVTVLRAAFNAGDAAEWGRAGPLLRFNAPLAAFPEWLEQQIDAHGVTDIVLYGDTRPIHAQAIQMARARGITTHCLEEGYVRPRWVSYERHGNNGNSRLMDISLPRMAQALGQGAKPEAEVPATWGDARQHLWHSFLYHARCLLPTRSFNRFPRHRRLPLWREAAWYTLRYARLPSIWLYRSIQQWLLLRSNRVFHLALLQLSFDASMQDHSDYDSTSKFVEDVIDAFAEGAEPDEYLVVKAHPFEDGRERLGSVIREMAQDLGVGKRVIFVDGGKKLASLLDRARSAITVNSTAAQQALWRGLPVAALGRAIYRKPSLVSEQNLVDFMRHPRRPDLRSYWLFRSFMMQTSQFRGSYYAAAGIEELLLTLPRAMLSDIDRYDRVLEQTSDLPHVPAVHRPTLIFAS
ncbi:MAG: capsule biosynthesis protein CapA [Pseudomonadota bacterium]